MASMYRSSPVSRSKRFDEYYRCYPIAMLPGPERESINHGGKVIMPPSALDKLTRLHITYPMLFELENGAVGRTSHAGVLEFIAEEGRCYLPYWTMQTLGLEAGDLLHVLSTDLPAGSFVKLQPQSTEFLTAISDPKAVLEKAFRDYACLTKGDVFTFTYNNGVFAIEVLETKPDVGLNGAISVLETDLEVDFAPPVGYEEPTPTNRQSAAGRGGGSTGVGNAGTMHPAAHGTMAAAINYASIAPPSAADLQAAANGPSVHFLSQGNRLKASKTSSAAAAKAKGNDAAPADAADVKAIQQRRRNGPQPLRLPPGKLFFGYEIKPLRKPGDPSEEEKEGPRFQGQGQTLRKKK